MAASAHHQVGRWRVLPIVALLVPILAIVMLVALVRGPRLIRPWHVVPISNRALVVPAGSVAYAQTVDAHLLRPGDVVVYRRPEEPGLLLVHRVDEIRPPGPIGTGVVAVMRGSDPSETPYYIQFAGDVQRVTFAVPLVGRFGEAWQRHGGELVVGVAALALNGLWFARGLRRRSHWRVQAVT